MLNWHHPLKLLTPLSDGKVIKVEHAPTAFGPVSFRVESRLSGGEVLGKVELPARNEPAKTLFRVRVPDGWKAISASVAGKRLAVDRLGTVDLTGLAGKMPLSFTVVKE